MHKISTIGILGCGWLGLSLAKHLFKKGFQVKGSTTTPAKLPVLEAAGIHPFLLDIEKDLENTAEFFSSELLIINVPPSKASDSADGHFGVMKNTIEKAVGEGVKFILFISSTSVYGEQNSSLVETDKCYPETSSGKALLELEKLLTQDTRIKASVVRFGGLIGPNRHPIKHLSGRSNIQGGNTPVNLIHLDDCIGIISSIIEQNAWEEIFNACADIHPKKEDFYTEIAHKAKLPEPHFDECTDGLEMKVVDSSKLNRLLNYTLKYRNPMDMPVELSSVDK